MSTFTYHHTRTRDHNLPSSSSSPSRSSKPYNYNDYYDLKPTPTTNTTLTRRDPKLIYHSSSSDNEEDTLHDDYPYSTTYKPLSKPKYKPKPQMTAPSSSSASPQSHHLIPTVYPSHLERYNIWTESSHAHTSSSSSSSRHHHHHHYTRHTPPLSSSYSEHDDGGINYRYHTKTVRPAALSRRDSGNGDGDREYKLKLKATLKVPGPRASSGEGSRDVFWSSGEVYRRKERVVDEGWEMRERERERERETKFRFRRVKRTRTEEWKPLKGFKGF